jgi:hypothetical protein
MDFKIRQHLHEYIGRLENFNSAVLNTLRKDRDEEEQKE